MQDSAIVLMSWQQVYGAPHALPAHMTPCAPISPLLELLPPDELDAPEELPPSGVAPF